MANEVAERSMPNERIITIDVSSALMPAVYALRHEVFVVEQAVPVERERDEFDESAVHLAALRGDVVVGTLRILMSGATARFGRMAVRASARRTGVGTRLMTAAEALAAQMGAHEIALHAQLTVRDFYRRLGYREEGVVFEEAGILHIGMRK
jgi:predicted GNAT family N-acyltransferase